MQGPKNSELLVHFKDNLASKTGKNPADLPNT